MWLRMLNCQESVGLCRLPSINDRGWKYTIILRQTRGHPGDTHPKSVCVGERMTAWTRVQESSETLKRKDTNTLSSRQEVVKTGRKTEKEENIFIAAANVFVHTFKYKDEVMPLIWIISDSVAICTRFFFLSIFTPTIQTHTMPEIG